MNEETCFNCDTVVKGNICSKCGYEFSLSIKCPRLAYSGVTCVHTRRVCSENDWQNCKVLRKND